MANVLANANVMAVWIWYVNPIHDYADRQPTTTTTEWAANGKHGGVNGELCVCDGLAQHVRCHRVFFRVYYGNNDNTNVESFADSGGWG